MPMRVPPRKISLPNKVQSKAVQVPARIGGPPASDTNTTGSGGFAQARAYNEEFARNRASRQERGMEFNMKQGEGGTAGITVILTDRAKKPDMPYFQHTHRWGFEQGSPKTEVCIQDGPDGCPLCRSLNKKGSFEMVLSCIDTRPFKYKKGPNAGKTVPRSRKPYVVKTSMIPVFERIYNKYGTFRGLVLKLFRDGGKNSPASGSQVEVVRQLTEAELAKYGDLSKPIDYTKAYPRLTAGQMAAQYGADATGAVGSDDFADSKKIASDDDLPF